MSKPLLGVMMLAKDEEKTILRSLESTRSVADEWIVVDTGSRDRTAEVARSFGARVIHVPWEDDFSKARNAGLAHVQAEWVLWLDADEELRDADSSWLEVLRHTEAKSFWLDIENLLGPSMDDRLIHRVPRLFRREPGVYFQGRIHEQIVWDQEGISETQIAPWRIVHHGYRPEVIARRDKVRRNLRLLRLALRDLPRHPFYTYQVGVTWCQAGRLDRAALWLSRAASLTPLQAPYRPTLFRDLGMVWLALGKFRDVELTLRPELERYPKYADLFVIFADALRAQGLREEALKAYLQAAACPPPGAHVGSAGINSFRPLHAAAQLCLDLGQLQEAEQSVRQALAARPGWEPALETLAEILAARDVPEGDLVKALASCAGTPPDQRSLVRALLHIGAYGEVIGLLDSKDTSLGSENRPLRVQCLVALGQWREACQIVELSIHSGDRQVPLGEEEIMDYALARWAQDQSLDRRLELPPVYQSIDARLMGSPASPDTQSHAAIGPDILRPLIQRAVQHRLIPLAEDLAALHSNGMDLFLAKTLYREGWVYLAADRLLRLLTRRELDAEGLFLLGEMLYDKGHWDQAAELFEQSAGLGFSRARPAAAAAALQSAKRMLEEAEALRPKRGGFAEERRAVGRALELLDGIGWHTHWRGRTRRNRHESAADLPLHDRQE
ncbi:glycosyltransferase [Kyrpidia spormannii]|uniref:Uncharacterized protein n=2 Tax=Kyrpidia spormannii TaxID=2055160 RepID=A0ACA8ZAD6_9BACL|nr:glycosyltransferase [Kyrpidia spormannii]CAB3393083.1 conserved protein of unknown function [Kyrpidia spormannii]CAB3393998.1 conserved protein of unknown function [Kyrpidia spormannii]